MIKPVFFIVVLLLLACPCPLWAQSAEGNLLKTKGYAQSFVKSELSTPSPFKVDPQEDTTDTTTRQQFPDPESVMYNSLIIPGWGQVVNDQIWKVPLVYAALGGLTYYSIYLTKRYHDYRAAHYNVTHTDTEDRPFGSTPVYLRNVSSSESLRNARNYYRNRRDFMYIAIGLAYGLNALDAYVYAHMRSFNVSENLSLRSRIKPGIRHDSPVLTLRLELSSP